MNKTDKIVITGAAGFIGSNFAKYLNQQGYCNLVLIDDLTDGHKFKNIKDVKFSEYLDKTQLSDFLLDNSKDAIEEAEEFGLTVEPIACIIHMGACSSTTEWNGRKMMIDNYETTRTLVQFCQVNEINLIYASSASVYGNKQDGQIDPLNVYAFSKHATDMYVTNLFKEWAKEAQETNTNINEIMTPLAGLRFFNVYGPNEDHKADQASPIHKFFQKMDSHDLNDSDSWINIFDIDSQRDFIYVEDVCKVMLYLMENPYSGIFDVGTGEPRSFEDVAQLIADKKPYGKISFPEHLKNHYQYYTKANLEPLRAIGYTENFLSLEEGIQKFKEQRG